MDRFCQGTRPVSLTMVTDRLLAVGGLFGEADCVARRAFRGVADVIAGRKPARKTNRGVASLSGDSLAAMVFFAISECRYLVFITGMCFCDNMRSMYRSRCLLQELKSFCNSSGVSARRWEGRHWRRLVRTSIESTSEEALLST